jgi:hypothetical protein
MEGTIQAKQETEKKPAKRQIKNYLLDRQFQLRWVLRATTVIILVVTVMGYFLYRTVADASDQLLLQQADNPHLTNEAFQAFHSQNDKDKTTTLWILTGWLVSLVALLSLATIVLTHKSAGPLYKMRRLFSTIDGEHLQLWARLRRGDELKSVFSEFDAMLLRLREHRHRDIDELEKIREIVAQGENIEEGLKRLDNLVERYRNSVKMD